MDEMTSIGTALAGLKSQLGVTTDSPSSSEPTSGSQHRSLERLQSLRPTAEYAAALEQLQAEIDSVERSIGNLRTIAASQTSTDPDAPTPQTIEAARLSDMLKQRLKLVDARERIERVLDECRERDRIAVDRPDGCWCLGVGAIGERFVPDGDGGGIPVHTEYCECLEGQSMRESDDRIRAAYRNGMRKARLERYFGSTRIPQRYATVTLDSYPATSATAEIVERLRGYAASCGQREGSSILLWGLYGTGKTGLSIATMRSAIEAHGLDALFTTVPDLLNEIRSTFGANSQRPRLPYAEDQESLPGLSSGELQRLVRDTSLLVLDDLGTERVTGWVAETLFELINHRYNRMLRTIFTSNLDPELLIEHLGERISWRIAHMSDVLHLNGPNLRLPEASR